MDSSPLKFLDKVGTFFPGKAIEIKQNGQTPLGADGFNAPSLLGVGTNQPYLHDGGAQTLEAVFPLHALGGGTIQTTLDDTERSNLASFLRQIDGRSLIVQNNTDRFKNPFLSQLP